MINIQNVADDQTFLKKVFSDRISYSRQNSKIEYPKLMVKSDLFFAGNPYTFELSRICFSQEILMYSKSDGFLFRKRFRIF